MMDNKDTMYGRQNQRPAWLRFLDIILRTAHVLVISVLFGGAVLKIPVAGLFHWQYLAAGTGIALIASEVLHSRHWPYQGRGVLVFIHIGLFSLVGFRPDLALPCLLAAIVVGMFGSHMPKRLRYWSFVHRQVKE
jgi:hypothetical protein